MLSTLTVCSAVIVLLLIIIARQQATAIALLRGEVNNTHALYQVLERMERELEAIGLRQPR